MLLAIDVGNTAINFGVFRGEELVANGSVATVRNRTVDELGLLFLELLTIKGIPSEDIDGAVLSCVVPQLLHSIEDMVERYFGLKILVLKPGVKTGMPILYENPQEVGADRIANAVAAYNKVGGPSVVVDFGTATTFDVISKKGEYLGGLIAPGPDISAEALFIKAAKLPRVEFAKPLELIGKNTVASIQAGLFYGYLGLVEGILERLIAELGENTKVIATGGLAVKVMPDLPLIKRLEPYLTLEGLRIIYQKNRH
ncbi:MAG: type III pantothenate kinase [Acidobacteria bacterium]|nr:type III pantothenate kinase [Acidobacteriota bacterium]